MKFKPLKNKLLHSGGEALEFLLEIIVDFKEGFMDKMLILRAAALSYTTVLCIIPLLAVAFTVSNLLLAQMDPAETDQIIDTFMVRIIPQVQLLEEDRDPTLIDEDEYPAENALPTREELRTQIKNFMQALGTGRIGLMGVGFLIFLALSLLITMEHTFNDIWEVEQGRPLLIRITMYWSVMTLGLIMLLSAYAMTGYWQGTRIARRLRDIPYAPGVLQFLTPFFIFWVALTFIYLALPNTRVKFIPAFTGAVFGGTLLQLNNIMNAVYITNIAMARRFYGGLGILPIILLGLFISWLFVLSGGQLAYSVETIWEENYKQTSLEEN